MKIIRKIFSILITVYIIAIINMNSIVNAINISNNCDLPFLKQNKDMLNSNKQISKTLIDLSGNTFKLVEMGNKGYYIIDKKTNKYLEYSNETPSPYLTYNKNLYYFGPTNYYIFDGTSYKHTILKDEKLQTNTIFNIQQNFTMRILQSRKIKNISPSINILSIENINFDILKSSKKEYNYIKGADWIRYANYPPNINGTCGYTAATILLSYWHNRYRYKKIIPEQYMETKESIKTTGYTLHDKLRSYGNSNSSWAKDIKEALNAYCKEYNVNGKAYYFFGKIGATDELKKDRPVILFGSLPNVAGKGKVNHAIVAYGIMKKGTSRYYITNYGWNGYKYNHVMLDAGLIGSNTHFKLNI